MAREKVVAGAAAGSGGAAFAGWPVVLSRLAAGSDLTAAEAKAALAEVFDGDATAAQLAAFVFGLRCKGETVEEMTGMVQAMLAAATPLPVAAPLRTRLVDTCGTGGDRSGTINISTIAALVVAGAGIPVCKHGGRAASSQAGSADVLEALGVVIDLGPAGVLRCIEEAGIGFCFAPRYHPAMRHAVPVRREIGVPTAFNFLGPLANPARVTRQMVGVGDPAMAERICQVLVAGGAVEVAVVYGSDGLDELTTTGPSTLVRWSGGGAGGGGVGGGGVGGGGGDAGGVAGGGGGAGGGGEAGGLVNIVVDPAALGLAPARREDLAGGDADLNATYARRVLEGKRGSHRDVVLLNAAAALVVGGGADDLAEGVSVAGESIDSGRAEQALEQLIATSQEAAGSPA